MSNPKSAINPKVLNFTLFQHILICKLITTFLCLLFGFDYFNNFVCCLANFFPNVSEISSIFHKRSDNTFHRLYKHNYGTVNVVDSKDFLFSCYFGEFTNLPFQDSLNHCWGNTISGDTANEISKGYPFISS